MMRSPTKVADIQAELDTGELPDDVAHVWEWFREVHLGRQPGSFGPAGISHMDLLAWRINMRRRPTPSEISAILYLDRVWLSVQSDAAEKKSKAQKAPSKKGR